MSPETPTHCPNPTERHSQPPRRQFLQSHALWLSKDMIGQRLTARRAAGSPDQSPSSNTWQSSAHLWSELRRAQTHLISPGLCAYVGGHYRLGRSVRLPRLTHARCSHEILGAVETRTAFPVLRPPKRNRRVVDVRPSGARGFGTYGVCLSVTSTNLPGRKAPLPSLQIWSRWLTNLSTVARGPAWHGDKICRQHRIPSQRPTSTETRTRPTRLC